MKKVAFLISWKGSTALAVIKAIKDGNLTGVEPAVVISSWKDSPGLQAAKDLGIPTEFIDPEKPDSESFGRRLLDLFYKYKVGLVSQNGWIPFTPKLVVDAYQGRLINQHPGSLDPGRHLDFGGRGMIRIRSIAAQFAYSLEIKNDYWIEATTQFVDEDFDKGLLIRTEKMDLKPHIFNTSLDAIRNNDKDKKAFMIETRKIVEDLFPVEYHNVIATLQMFAEGEVKGFIRKIPLIPQENEHILKKAKLLAVEMFPDD